MAGMGSKDLWKQWYVTMIRPPPLEQITAPKRKKCDLKNYGNKTVMRGTVFNLMLHMIVQEPRGGNENEHQP